MTARRSFLLASLSAAVARTGLFAADTPARIRVLLVTGGHSHEISFYSTFDGAKDLAITVEPHPKAYARDLRKSVDVIVMYDMVADLEEKQKQNLRDFAESGKGIVALHHAICSFPKTWPWFTQELIGGSYLDTSTYHHDQELNVTAPISHPITSGVAPMRLIDETYNKMWISPRNKILLRTDHRESDGPVAWISSYEKSRVVYIQLGHGHEAHEHPSYRTLVHQAIQWSAGKLA